MKLRKKQEHTVRRREFLIIAGGWVLALGAVAGVSIVGRLVRKPRRPYPYLKSQSIQSLRHKARAKRPHPKDRLIGKEMLALSMMGFEGSPVNFYGIALALATIESSINLNQKHPPAWKRQWRMIDLYAKLLCLQNDSSWDQASSALMMNSFLSAAQSRASVPPPRNPKRAYMKRIGGAWSQLDWAKDEESRRKWYSKQARHGPASGRNRGPT